MDNLNQKFGRFTLIKLLARGGMGEVYLATLSGAAGFEKRCIVKKIRADLASDKSFVNRFLNEGRTLQVLNHSNIVQIYDMGESNGEYFLAMEYVSGADLRFLLKTIKTNDNNSYFVPVDVAIAVILEVLKGLGYAHNAADNNGNPLMIVHRDISPSNILISEQGEVKIIDFGIAKAKTIESIAGIVQGKFAYMSPEQARGESLDRRTDIFSLGIVFYEMLSGIRPFEGGSDLQSLERIKSEDYRSVLSYNPDVDEALDAILRKALEKNREDRYQSADDFYDALYDYAREHQLIAGMRDISAFFKPWMRVENQISSANDVMGAALDAMLLAQNGDSQYKTQTLMPSPSPGHDHAEPDTHDSHVKYLTQSGKVRVVDRSAFENVDVEAGTEDMPAISEEDVNRITGTSSTEIAAVRIKNTPENSMLKTDTPIPQDNRKSSGIDVVREDDNLIPTATEAASDQEKHRKRVWFKIRYLVIGAISGIIIFLCILFVWYHHLNDKDNAPLPSDNHVVLSPDKTEAADQKQTLDLPESPLDAPDNTQAEARGLPLLVTTQPDNASIYIIEGAYRSLKEKSVVLLPGVNAEIAIQAPGYETCLFHVYLEDSDDRKMKKTDWDNCRSVSANISSDGQFIELVVSLKQMIPGNSEPEAKEINTNDAIVDNINKTNTDDSARKKADKAKTDSAKNTKTTNVRETSSDTHKCAVSSNVPAEIMYDDNKYTLPNTLNVVNGANYKIMPVVNGRKIPVPKNASWNAAAELKTEFCEAAIRIQDSYVEGDPAPYQIADIAVDKVVYARQTDAAVFVMPCGKHTISAQIKAQGRTLSASVAVDLSPDKSYSTSLKLK